MKKIRYINQFRVIDDDDTMGFMIFSNRGLHYKSLSLDVAYNESNYLHFINKYSTNFKLEFIYG